jgi:hypothetical protein
MGTKKGRVPEGDVRLQGEEDENAQGVVGVPCQFSVSDK